MNISEITLEGQFIRLEPLSLKHLEDLTFVGLDENLWRLIPTQINNESDMKSYIETALKEKLQGVSIPFATILKSTGKPIGSTRFGNIDLNNKRLEIGWTWLTKSHQRTYANSEAKLLMLEYAFEKLNCNRVEFKTDSLNAKSQNAILRLGATKEGIFRQHIVCQNGRLRDSVYFSILDSEWEKIKNKLKTELYQ